MISDTLSFNKAYDSYYAEIMSIIKPNMQVLEIGGGAHPSIEDRSQITYTIVDPDSKELDKSPDDVIKLNLLLEEMKSEKQYDLIVTKMVLEHVEQPDLFHTKIFEILKPNGKAIHFFACRHSIPTFVNRLLPEVISDGLLRVLQNRNTAEHPKYPAFYKKTKGHTNSQVTYFQNKGFQVLKYNSFVGHKYFKSIPILKHFEAVYTRLLVGLKLKSLATVALIILKK
jgi:SAM-dependent methyltransferase